MENGSWEGTYEFDVIRPGTRLQLTDDITLILVKEVNSLCRSNYNKSAVCESEGSLTSTFQVPIDKTVRGNFVQVTINSNDSEPSSFIYGNKFVQIQGVGYRVENMKDTYIKYQKCSQGHTSEVQRPL